MKSREKIFEKCYLNFEEIVVTLIKVLRNFNKLVFQKLKMLSANQKRSLEIVIKLNGKYCKIIEKCRKQKKF